MNVGPALAKILELEGGDFEAEFFNYLSAKSLAGTLQPVEEEAWLILSMLPRIEMEGFVDLFYQLYSVRECATVRQALGRMGLNKLKGQFEEAFSIYVSGKLDIAEEEYRSIDPFGSSDNWSRFDAIGVQMLEEGSELYLVGERTEQYVKAVLR